MFLLHQISSPLLIGRMIESAPATLPYLFWAVSFFSGVALAVFAVGILTGVVISGYKKAGG